MPTRDCFAFLNKVAIVRTSVCTTDTAAGREPLSICWACPDSQSTPWLVGMPNIPLLSYDN